MLGRGIADYGRCPFNVPAALTRASRSPGRTRMDAAVIIALTGLMKMRIFEKKFFVYF